MKNLPTAMPMLTDLAWVAGIIDGEGCISICRQGRDWHLTVSVACVDPRMPERLRSLFGGSLSYRTRKGMRRPYAAWYVSSRQALVLLQQIRPYLVIKGEQADVAFEYGETIGVDGTGGGRRSLSAATVGRRIQLADALKSMHAAAYTLQEGGLAV